jgi:nucleotide sugar dehydrogenase
MKVAVIGAGKMGLPLACVFASRGATVVAADANPALVALVNAGAPPFDEPGLPELLAEAVGSGRLRATTDNREAIAASDVCVVIVPVMLTDEQRADLSIIRSIAEDLAASLRPGSLVSFETTLPVGETRRLGALVEQGGLRAGVDFDLVFSPERVKSQRVLRHLFDNPKVVGGITPRSAERGAAFYAGYLGAPVANVGTLEAAELVKLAGMVYRDVNIALANELARYAQEVGVDFEAVRQAANTDGEAYLLSPGIGVGGHCTPVYPYFVIHDARTRGTPTALAELARRVNEEQPARVLDGAGDLDGRGVLILGLAFRPQVKEAAYSPAFALRDEALRRGARVQLYDPLYSDAEVRRLGFEPGTPYGGHDVVVLNTAHDAFAVPDFARLAASGTATVVDGRNLWDAAAVAAAGLRYVGVGRPDPAGRGAPGDVVAAAGTV